MREQSSTASRTRPPAAGMNQQCNIQGSLRSGLQGVLRLAQKAVRGLRNSRAWRISWGCQSKRHGDRRDSQICSFSLILAVGASAHALAGDTSWSGLNVTVSELELESHDAVGCCQTMKASCSGKCDEVL